MNSIFFRQFWRQCDRRTNRKEQKCDKVKRSAQYTILSVKNPMGSIKILH